MKLCIKIAFFYKMETIQGFCVFQWKMKQNPILLNPIQSYWILLNPLNWIEFYWMLLNPLESCKWNDLEWFCVFCNLSKIENSVVCQNLFFLFCRILYFALSFAFILRNLTAWKNFVWNMIENCFDTRKQKNRFFVFPQIHANVF